MIRRVIPLPPRGNPGFYVFVEGLGGAGALPQ
jgi:hypothetical protein